MVGSLTHDERDKGVKVFLFFPIHRSLTIAEFLVEPALLKPSGVLDVN